MRKAALGQSSFETTDAADRNATLPVAISLAGYYFGGGMQGSKHLVRLIF